MTEEKCSLKNSTQRLSELARASRERDTRETEVRTWRGWRKVRVWVTQSGGRGPRRDREGLL